jgi:hypothetical protein
MTGRREHAGGKPRRFSWTLLVVSAVVIIMATGAAYWFVTQGPGQRIVSPPRSDVAQFRGEGDQTTDSFTVRGQWQVHWENRGDSFSFAISGDQDLGTIVNQEEPGSGVTSVVAAGTFHVEVVAEGSWTIRIEQGD